MTLDGHHRNRLKTAYFATYVCTLNYVYVTLVVTYYIIGMQFTSYIIGTIVQRAVLEVREKF